MECFCFFGPPHFGYPTYDLDNQRAHVLYIQQTQFRGYSKADKGKMFYE